MKPFEHPKYQERKEAAEKSRLRPCCVCGKGQRNPYTWVHVVNGKFASVADQDGSQGLFPICITCFNAGGFRFYMLGYTNELVAQLRRELSG